MKKRFVLFLVLMMFFALAACGGSTKNEDAGSGNENAGSTGVSSDTNSAVSEFPEKDVTIVVGSGAGGGLDLMSRAIQPAMSEALGVNVVVEDMKGGSGSVALQHIMDVAADGYNLYAISVDLIINDCFEKIEYTRHNLIPICRLQMDESVFWVKSDSPFQTMEDVIEWAKANPGKLNFGGVNAAGIDEVVIRYFCQLAGIEISFIPNESGSESMAALVGGHVDIVHEEPAAALSMYEAGEIRPILCLTEERLEAYPDIPTAVELGYDITLGNWRGLFVKEGTDRAIVDKLRDAIIAAMESEAYKEFSHNSLLDLRPGYADTEEFTAFLEEQYTIYHDVLSGLGYV